MAHFPVVKVTVPATTANLGSGFDCIGAAFTLYNQFEFAPAERLSITVAGSGQAEISTNPDNLVYRAFAQLYTALERLLPPIDLRISMGIPLARGLGSSATAIVGGLLGANVLAGNPLSQAEVMQLAIEMEGHPDNVVPALQGGCYLAATAASEGWQIAPVPWHPEIIPVVAIPDFQLATEKARAVLPETLSRADAIFNVAHFGLLLRALATGKGDWLRDALNDRLHQPYRQTLIPGYEAVQAGAIAAGAYGVVISGAGPTLLALTAVDKANAVAAAMKNAWTAEGMATQVHILSVDAIGARVQID
ncbi:MAG: homoserine kinase [Spirulina sp. SIO3F2]|nr:homoserine kinase [Spirulina sp. SIO3F2]